MTLEQKIAQILAQALGASQPLLAVLRKIADSGTDLAPVAATLLSAGAAALDSVNQVEVATALIPELKNILSGQIEPKDHPSDLA